MPTDIEQDRAGLISEVELAEGVPVCMRLFKVSTVRLLINENARLRAELAERDKAIRAILPFLSDDFPNGPDGECCATGDYRSAYKQLIAMTEDKTR